MIKATIFAKMVVEYDGAYLASDDVIKDVANACVCKTIIGSDREMRITKMEMY